MIVTYLRLTKKRCIDISKKIPVNLNVKFMKE